MAPHQDTALHTFASAYGQLCTNAAQALDAGSSREAVRVAMQGRGANIRLHHLRNQSYRTHLALDHAKQAGCESWTLVNRCNQIRHAIEEEWECRIPIVRSGVGDGS